MSPIDFIIELKSDAEPGTGMGGDIINDRVPRNKDGKPIIPATHLKGLMREELQKLELLFKEIFGDNFANECLGQPGPLDGSSDGENGQQACFFITDAEAKTNVETSFVSRTALDENSGTARETSLRTTERIPVGTTFHGKLILNVSRESRKGIAVQLALLSIAAIGGGRNRGCGQCVIRTEHEQESVETMFENLCKAEDFGNSESVPWDSENVKPVTLQLIFEAESPICCPETPVCGNVIRTGFVIPASAVQGFIVNHIAKQLGDAAATKCFGADVFRAWPLLPCAKDIDANHQYPVPTRVSLTHRVGKLSDEGKELKENEVADPAIEGEYDPKKAGELNPLKASDGVLLRSGNDVSLWKSRSMPRIVSAHGVMNDPITADSRNLYQVESMAPIVWSGIVRVPKFVAEALIKKFDSNKNKEERTAFFGRSRSVRGMGSLIAKQMDDGDKMLPWNMENKGNGKQAVIVQSPILFDVPVKPEQPAKEAFEKFIKTKWPEIAGDITVYGCAVGIQFGWNRNGDKLDVKRTGKGNRVQACQVIQPGAVIVFNNGVDKERLADCIKNGLGEGREQGFGAVALHPGKASWMFDSMPEEHASVSSDFREKAAVENALTIWKSHKTQLPSVSQLAAVRNFLCGKSDQKKNALAYLSRQKTGRTERIWDTWKKCHADIEKYINDHDPEMAEKGLKLIMDLKISEASKDREEN